MKTSIIILSLLLAVGLNVEGQGRGHGNHDGRNFNHGNQGGNGYNQRDHDGHGTNHGYNYPRSYDRGYGYNHQPTVYAYGHHRPAFRPVMMPYGAVVIRHRNMDYHYNNGYYYRPYGNSFRVTCAPMGMRIRTLPLGCFSWNVGPQVFFYFGGTFYSQIPQTREYEVIRPQIGSIVPNIPDDYNEISRNGETLLEVNGILYRPINTRNGEVFEVVGFLEVAG